MGTKGVVLSLALFMCTWRCFVESTMVPESDLGYENSHDQLQDRSADCQYCCTGGSCSGCPGFDGSSCSSYSCTNDGICNKCCTKQSELDCPEDLWSKYVTKGSKTLEVMEGNGGTNGDGKWKTFYSPQDLAALEEKIQVGKPYTVVYKVTSTCFRGNIVIGFEGSGGFLNGEIVPKCNYDNWDTCTKPQLVMGRGNWLGNGNSPTRLLNRSTCPLRRFGQLNTPYRNQYQHWLTIHNIYLFEGDDVQYVWQKCVQ